MQGWMGLFVRDRSIDLSQEVQAEDACSPTVTPDAGTCK